MTRLCFNDGHIVDAFGRLRQAMLDGNSARRPLVAAIVKHVTDRDTLNAIMDDIRALVPLDQ